MRLPLANVRVLEVGQVYAAPLATKPLADLGADVIKIESATRLDGIRFLGPPVENRSGERDWETTGRFHDANRNKYGVSLDIRKPEGKKLFRGLVTISDIVVENFTADVMGRLGLDYEALQKLRPDIIMLSSTGYGHSGPWRNYRAMGQSLETAFGMAHFTGYPDEPPMRCGMTYSDLTAGRAGAIAILIALAYRQRTGKGQWIDLSQYEEGVSLIGEGMMDFFMNQRVAQRNGNRSQYGAAPHGAYRCRGEDRWVAIAIATDEEWARLCEVLGNPEWTMDRRFADAISRYEHQDELDDLLEEWTSRHDAGDVTAILQQKGIAAGPVLTAKDLLLDPHLNERDFFPRQTLSATAEGVGTRPYSGSPWMLSGERAGTRMSCPSFGRDNEIIYGALLGVDLSDLRDEDVISTEPRPEALRPVATLDIAHQLQHGDLAGYDPDYKQILGLED